MGFKTKKIIPSDRDFQTHSICQLNFTYHHFSSPTICQILAVTKAVMVNCFRGGRRMAQQLQDAYKVNVPLLLFNMNFESLNANMI